LLSYSPIFRSRLTDHGKKTHQFVSNQPAKLPRQAVLEQLKVQKPGPIFTPFFYPLPTQHRVFSKKKDRSTIELLSITPTMCNDQIPHGILFIKNATLQFFAPSESRPHGYSTPRPVFSASPLTCGGFDDWYSVVR